MAGGRRLRCVTSAAGTTPDVTPLVVRTVAVEDPGSLLALLPKHGTLAWVHRGDGIVAWGEAAVLRTSGPDRFARARAWWSDQTRQAVVRDEVEEPGTGLVCFGSFGFSDDPGESVLVVPEVVVGLATSTPST